MTGVKNLDTDPADEAAASLGSPPPGIIDGFLIALNGLSRRMPIKIVKVEDLHCDAGWRAGRRAVASRLPAQSRYWTLRFCAALLRAPTRSPSLGDPALSPFGAPGAPVRASPCWDMNGCIERGLAVAVGEHFEVPDDHSDRHPLDTAAVMGALAFGTALFASTKAEAAGFVGFSCRLPIGSRATATRPILPHITIRRRAPMRRRPHHHRPTTHLRRRRRPRGPPIRRGAPGPMPPAGSAANTRPRVRQTGAPHRSMGPAVPSIDRNPEAMHRPAITGMPRGGADHRRDTRHIHNRVQPCERKLGGWRMPHWLAPWSISRFSHWNRRQCVLG
jgi:hypothetical protein